MELLRPAGNAPGVREHEQRRPRTNGRFVKMRNGFAGCEKGRISPAEG